MSKSESIEDASREELIQRIADLETEIQRLTQNVNIIFETQLPEVRSQIEQNRDDIADVEALAQNAIGIVQAESKTDAANQSKKGLAVRLIRQRLVKDCVKHDSNKAGVRTSNVQNMAQPEHDLARRTIHDAFDALEDAWEAFEHESGTPGPEGKENRLKCDGELLEPSLLRGVAESLTKDGLRETLITCAESGGGVSR